MLTVTAVVEASGSTDLNVSSHGCQQGSQPGSCDPADLSSSSSSPSCRTHGTGNISLITAQAESQEDGAETSAETCTFESQQEATAVKSAAALTG